MPDFWESDPVAQHDTGDFWKKDRVASGKRATARARQGPPAPTATAPGKLPLSPSERAFKMGAVGRLHSSEQEEPPPEEMRVGGMKHTYSRSRGTTTTTVPGKKKPYKPLKPAQSVKEFLTTPFGMGYEAQRKMTATGNDLPSAISRAFTGMATPANLGIGGAAAVTGGVAPVAARLLQLGFSAQAVKNFADQVRSGQGWDAAISGLFGAAMLHGALQPRGAPLTVQPPSKVSPQEVSRAAKEGQVQEGAVGEHPGVPQGRNVPANKAEVGQGGGGQAGRRGGVRPTAKVEGQAQAKPVAPQNDPKTHLQDARNALHAITEGKRPLGEQNFIVGKLSTAIDTAKAQGDTATETMARDLLEDYRKAVGAPKGKYLAGGTAAGQKRPVTPEAAGAMRDKIDAHLQSPAPQTTPTGGGSGQLQSTIIPGIEEFIEQDVAPALQEMKEKPAEVRNALAQIFNPPGVSESAGLTAQRLRANLGANARSMEVARTVLGGVRNFFTKSLVRVGGAPIKGGAVQWNHPTLRFVRSMEAGKPLDSDMKQFQPLADWMRDSREATWKKIQDAGISQAFLDNYWPHIWQKPGRVATAMGRLFGRRPFAGPETFRKQRTLPTFDEGLQKGMQPITWNPVEQHLIHLHEMNRSLAAHDTWNYLKAQKLAKFVRFGDLPPDGYSKVNDRIARAIEMQPTVTKSGAPGAPQPVLRGEWYLPTPAATVLNNYLSPGLSGTPAGVITDALRGVGNTLNQAQLGLSAFHLTFVGLDSAASHTAIGIQALTEGRIGAAAKGLAQGLTGYAAPKSLVRGDIIARAYRNPKLDPNSPIGQTINLLERAGARINQAPEYTNRSIASLTNALERHNYPGAAFRLVPAVFELTAKPVMEYAVPRLKLGVAEAMLKNEVQRLGPKATQEQLTAAAQRVWDSVDNRMGQLVYDNLFWHNYLKESGQLMQRSLGWNLGSVRELGGAGKDVLTTPWRLKGGDRVFTQRMAYAAALPLQVALTGAIIYRLYNGRNPTTLKDMLQPTIDGERWQLASYMRDVMPVYDAAKEGVPGLFAEVSKRSVSKLNPVFSTTREFLRNQDYWGNPIYGERGQGVVTYLISQGTPFALREPPAKPRSAAEQKRQFFGLTRAPKPRTVAEQEYGEGLGLIKAATKAGYKPKRKSSTAIQTKLPGVP